MERAPLGRRNRAGGGRYRKRGFLRAGCRSGRRPRRARGAAEVRRKETEVPKAATRRGVDRRRMLIQWVAVAEARREGWVPGMATRIKDVFI